MSYVKPTIKQTDLSSIITPMACTSNFSCNSTFDCGKYKCKKSFNCPKW